MESFRIQCKTMVVPHDKAAPWIDKKVNSLDKGERVTFDIGNQKITLGPNGRFKKSNDNDENNNSIHKKDICEAEPEELIKNIGTDDTYKRKIVWGNVIGFIFLHTMATYGYLLMFKANVLTYLWGLAVILLGSEGVLIGAHRLWSHKCFKATTPLKIILMIAQTVAGQNCLWIWIRDHRQHHRYSDTDGDPHNSQRGLFFSHMGWLMVKKHPMVIKAGKTVYMDDINEDPIIMFQKKYYHPLFMIFGFAIPVYVPVLFWGESLWYSFLICFFARYVTNLHFTWSVNSLAHYMGTRPYDKKKPPSDSAFVSAITLGEGWHNYHHVYPWDYKASELGRNYQITTRLIETLHRLNMVYDLREAPKTMIDARAKRTGDGSVRPMN